MRFAGDPAPNSDPWGRDPFTNARRSMNSKTPPNSTPVAPTKSAFAAIRNSYLKLIGLGVVAGGLGGMALVMGNDATPWATYAPALLGAPFLIGIGVWGLRVAATMPVLSSSYNLIQAGKLADAEALLDGLASYRMNRVVAVVNLQRALIAIRRGDLSEALRRLDLMVERKVGWAENPLQEVERSMGFGLRAWVRAATGNTAGAEADVQASRSYFPNAEGFAFASLAEALLLQRAGEKGALGALLKRDRLLLMSTLQPRERALVRAMSRMLRAPVESVYRTKVDPKKTDGTRNLAPEEWVERVAPDLSQFVPATFSQSPENVTAAPSVRAPSHEALAQVAASEPPKKMNGALRLFLLWALLIAMFAGIWTFVQQPTRPGSRRKEVVTAPVRDDRPKNLIMGGTLAVVALMVGSAVVRRRRKSRDHTQRLYALQYAVLSGKNVQRELVDMANDPAELTAAQAELLHASIVERSGDIALSLRHIDAARAKIQSEAARLNAGGFLTPGIAAARAYSLAALQRPDEAAAELSQLPPDYLFLDRMRFVVPLVAMVAEGDLENAGRLAAATSPDLAVGYRDELLREVVLAATSPESVGASELMRLRDELADREEDRRWMMRVAPALITRFDAAISAEPTVE